MAKLIKTGTKLDKDGRKLALSLFVIRNEMNKYNHDELASYLGKSKARIQRELKKAAVGK